MNIRSLNRTIRLAGLLTAVLVYSCGNRPQRKSLPANKGSSIRLYIRDVIAGADLNYDSIYHDTTSRAYKIIDFRYYISNIRAIRHDEVEQPVACAAILVDPGRRMYDLGSLPEGAYKGLRFIIGLDSAVNHGDPTVFEPGHPLAIKTPSMHWDWNSGYLFMKIEGKVDTTGKGLGPPVTEFFYHIGMDRMKRTIEIPMTFRVDKSSGNSLRLKFNLTALLGCIDLRSEISTHTFDNQSLAGRIADSWQTAFSPDN
jgi:hypothetical protein